MGLSGHASGEAVVGATIGMVSLAALFVLTRLFIRLRVVRDPGLDDGFIVAALLFSIATTTTMCLQVKYGMGRHMDTLAPNDAIESQKPFYVSVWVYNLSMSCTKVSILLQYLRIFPQKAFRKTCFLLMAVVVIYTCWVFFSAVFACWPIPYFWNPKAYPNGHCLPRFPVWFANTAINVATDIATAILPLPVLNQLQLPKRQKIALMVVFVLGGFTCIISILRIESLRTISKAKDITWENPMAAIWSSAEANTGILCSSLPTLRGLIIKIFPRSFGSNQSPYNAKRSSNASGGRRSGSTPQHSFGSKAKASLEHLAKTLTGKGDVTLRSYVNGRTDSTLEEDLELTEAGPKDDAVDENHIQVVTTLEQGYENASGQRKRSETDSVRGLT